MLSAHGWALAEAVAPTGPGPFVVPMAQLDAGNTAWLMTSAVLVLLMSIPGLALFYAGMVRKKNILATMAQTLAVCALVSVLWWTVATAWPSCRATSSSAASRGPSSTT